MKRVLFRELGWDITWRKRCICFSYTIENGLALHVASVSSQGWLLGQMEINSHTWNWKPLYPRSRNSLFWIAMWLCLLRLVHPKHPKVAVQGKQQFGCIIYGHSHAPTRYICRFQACQGETMIARNWDHPWTFKGSEHRELRTFTILFCEEFLRIEGSSDTNLRACGWFPCVLPGNPMARIENWISSPSYPISGRNISGPISQNLFPYSAGSWCQLKCFTTSYLCNLDRWANAQCRAVSQLTLANVSWFMLVSPCYLANSNVR